MERLNMVLDYYLQNQILFAIVVLIILVLLVFRFKSLPLRLFLLALVLVGTYFWATHLSGVASEFKEVIIEKYFPRERLK